MDKKIPLGKFDFHVHTIHSNCGKAGMTPSAALGMYSEAGYRALGFTDHFDPVLSPEKIRQTKEELSEYDAGDIEYYIGVEASTYLPDWPRRELSRMKEKHLDFCILSPSHRPSSSEAPAFSRLPVEIQARKILDAFIEAVRTEFADAIAHPFAYGASQIPDRDRVLSEIHDSDLSWALELAGRNGIAMELSPRVLGIGEEFLSRFIGLCKEEGLMFSIGGDVHAPQSIGNDGLVHPILSKYSISEEKIWFPERR
jgi:histidinol phosphatase-like PHP family hydrolase